MAISRYAQGKNHEEEEDNAIGTEYVRVDLLAAADAAKVRALLRNYLVKEIRVHGEFVNPPTNGSARGSLVRYRHRATVRIHEALAHNRRPPVGHHRQSGAPGRSTRH